MQRMIVTEKLNLFINYSVGGQRSDKNTTAFFEGVTVRYKTTELITAEF